MKEQNKSGKTKKGRCNKCAFYQAFYHRGFFAFRPVKQGLCKRCQNVVKEKDYCEFWKMCKENIATLRQLDKAVEDVEALKEIYDFR